LYTTLSSQASFFCQYNCLFVYRQYIDFIRQVAALYYWHRVAVGLKTAYQKTQNFLDSSVDGARKY